MKAKKRSVSMTPDVEALIRERGDNFSLALRRVVATQDQLAHAALSTISARKMRRLRDFSTQFVRAWSDFDPVLVWPAHRLRQALPKEVRRALGKASNAQVLALYDYVLRSWVR